MKQYKNVFARGGVTDMFQLESLSDKVLRVLYNVHIAGIASTVLYITSSTQYNISYMICQNDLHDLSE